MLSIRLTGTSTFVRVRVFGSVPEEEAEAQLISDGFDEHGRFVLLYSAARDRGAGYRAPAFGVLVMGGAQ